MPITNQYALRQYRAKQYEDAKQRMYVYLGGKCSFCGSTDKSKFEIHHVNSSEKSFSLTAWWARRWEVLQQELDKCILVCRKCHHQKHTNINLQHGTNLMYRHHKCRCNDCRDFNSRQIAEWRRQRKTGARE